jgi:hypothetical protein
MVWFSGMARLQNIGVVYRGSVPNQQVEQLLAGEPKTFVSPGDDFLAEYALFGRNGDMLQSNVEGKKLEVLAGFLQKGANNIDVLRYTYSDGSTVICRWQYRSEFADPVLRDMLPPLNTCGWPHLVWHWCFVCCLIPCGSVGASPPS